MRNIHQGLKWQTILNRINKIRKDTEFRLLPDDSIQQLKENGWIYVCKTTYEKSRFIEEEAYQREAPKVIELTVEQQTDLLNRKVANEFKQSYYPLAFGKDKRNWP